MAEPLTEKERNRLNELLNARCALPKREYRRLCQLIKKDQQYAKQAVDDPVKMP